MRGRHLLVVAGALGPVAAGAQPATGHPTPLGWERLTGALLLPERDTLPGGLRLAGLPVDAPATVRLPGRRLAVTGGEGRGTLRRPQEGARQQGALAVVEGERPGGRWWTHGGVRYRRGSDQQVPWRHHADPYAGLPYQWADSVGGTFHQDALGVRGGLVSPSWRRVRLGVALDYDVQQGARREDPRPLHRQRVVALRPALAWAAGAQQLVVGAERRWFREDLEIGGGSSTDFPVLFRLRGYGTFDRTQLISAERAVLGGEWSARGAYAIAGRRWHGAVGGWFGVARDSVRDGIATPVSGGEARRVIGAAGAQLRRLGGRPLELALSWHRIGVRGRDPIFAAVNATETGAVARAVVRGWSAPMLERARWHWAVQLLPRSLAREDAAAQTRWSVQALGVGGALAHRRPVAGGALLLLAHGTRHHTSDARLEARRPTRLTPLLATADWAVVSAPLLELGGGVGWEGGTVGAPRTRLFLGFDHVARTAAAVGDTPSSAWQRLTLRLEWH
jgi:hypothetical protein